MEAIKFQLGIAVFLVGLLLAAVLVWGRAQRSQRRESLLAMGLSLVFAPFASHLLYSLIRFGYAFYDKGLSYALLPFQGGFTVYGALLGIVLAIGLSAKLCHSDAMPLMDLFAPALLLLLAFSRFAEGLWFMGFGRFVEMEEHMFFPLSIFDASYESWLYAVFMAEAAYALLCGILLLAFGKRQQMFSALILYSAMQMIFESMRQDEILRWGFVLCNQVFSLLILLGILLYYLLWRKASIGQWLLSLTIFLLCIGVIVVMEFALEGRVPIIEHFTHTDCYTTDLLAMLLLMALLFFQKSIYLKKQAA